MVRVACRLLLVAGLAAFAAVGCESDTIGSDWHRVEPPAAAPDFTVLRLNGPPVALSAYRGDVVIMEFWATWCGPCRFSLPSLEVIYRKYHDRGLSVLLINEGESAEAVRAWVARRFTAPILLDRDGKIGEHYQVRALPRLFIVDRQGRVIYTHSGYGGGLERNLTLILDGVLAGNGSMQHG